MNLGKHRQRGFTLLELLAATVVLALGLAVLMNALSDAMHHQARDASKNHIAQVALSIMAELSLKALRPGSEEGERDGVHWHLQYSLQDRQPGGDLYHLVLTLRQGKYEERFTTQRLTQASSP